MPLRANLTIIVTTALATSCLGTGDAAAQGRLAGAKGLRCTFPLQASATWKADGAPQGAIKPAELVLIFDSIDADDGTARLRSGTTRAELIVRSGGGYLRRHTCCDVPKS